jgi:hypothetical protein
MAQGYRCSGRLSLASRPSLSAVDGPRRLGRGQGVFGTRSPRAGDDVHGTSNPMAQATRRYTNISMETVGSGSSLEQWSGWQKLDCAEGGGQRPVGDGVREEVLQL